jgi:hypothetical protein
MQIHDYSPGIAANGLFWVIPTARDSIKVDFDSGVASLRVVDVAVTDAHDLLNNLTNGHGFPSLGVPPVAPIPATVSFDIEWSGITESAKVVNLMQNFRGQFVKTGATIDWSAQSANFAFQSEAPNPARNLYSVIAHEQNGVFFHLEADDE